ncbi:hypothetical protein [uncultured Prevotella sp.]|uniref:hypothetical protein n=1 Tax=uncultured Prevotella sp. TaxID=159272 RepID=UPI0025F99EA0|nr:hypothetical protein [uncultured Prevotella sp.]
MEREAEYYEVAEGGNVVCRLCPHGCRLADGYVYIIPRRSSHCRRLWPCVRFADRSR